MIQSMDWLKGAQGDKIILSGTNIPVTVLNLVSTKENGINNYKISHDSAMTELLADNSDILAFKSVNEA